MLVAVGYDPALAPTRVPVTTGSGVEYAPRVTLSRILALDKERVDFAVTLPVFLRRAAELSLGSPTKRRGSRSPGTCASSIVN
jgi:hypothetical protein